MHEQQSATVETLTAEVRVLMVGNRQVTLSVVRQLDVLVSPLDAEGFTPFGRISTGERVIREDGFHTFRGSPYLEMIGRDASGALVRFVVADPPSRRIYSDAWVDLVEAWRELPLIVLAGLR